MKFFTIFSSVLFILYFYTGWKFIYPNNYSNYQNTSLWFICILCYFLPVSTFYLRINKFESTLIDKFTWISYLSLGICSILFFTLLLIDIFTLSTKITPYTHNFDPNRKAFLGLSFKTIMAGVGGIFSVYGILNGVQNPKVITQKVKFNKLPQDLKQFKIAHISDLHVGSQIKSDLVINVVQKIYEGTSLY